jgi:hypothetical protein
MRKLLAPIVSLIMSQYLQDRGERKVEPFTSLASYTYTPLQMADSIRLIELLPGREDFPLRCNIFQACRSRNAIRHEALSYAWGEPKFVRQLEEAATRTVISITQSLYEALQALRDQELSMWLWVDALCIAQGDVQEKNHQVRQMAEIYREAESVIVWTGNDQRLDIFETLVDVGQLCEKAIESGNMPDSHRYFENEIKMRLRRCDPTGIRDFFDRPWFNRVWTVQEFVLAKKLYIHAGRVNMVYSVFKFAVRACVSLLIASQAQMWYEIISRVGILVELREMFGRHLFIDDKTRDSERLTYCLDALDGRQCSNESDNFYSILGLLPDDFGISPNYDLPIFDVRMDVTKKILLAGNISSLDNAETFMNSKISTSVPSFLIRFPYSKEMPKSVRLQPFSISSKLYGSTLKDLIGLDGPTVEDTGPLTIGLQGTSIDRVVKLVFCKEIEGTYELSSDESLLDHSDFNPLLFDLIGIYGVVSEAHHSQNGPVHAECNEIERCFWYTINNRYPSVQYTDSDDLHTRLQNFEIKSSMSYQRVFFVTECGLFGLCSRWTRISDYMVCFQGAEKPHILRPVVIGHGEKTWKLIGDCYFDDSMIGHCVAFDCDNTSGEEVEGLPEPQNNPKVPRRNRLFAEQFVIC